MPDRIEQIVFIVTVQLRTVKLQEFHL
jgi:hypothetical protein